MENKFRGQQVDNKEWVYGSLINIPDAKNGFKSTIVSENANLWYTLPSGELHIDGNSWNWVILETVGKYTGLSDKNNVEIYKDDIVRIENQNGEFCDFNVYPYGNTLCMDCGSHCGEDYDICPLDFLSFGDDYESLEVVGNSHTGMKEPR